MSKVKDIPAKSSALVVADSVLGVDSEDSSKTKRFLLSALKTLFDGVYALTGHTHTDYANKFEEDVVPIEFAEDGAVAPDAAELYTNTNAKCRVRKFAGDADQDVVFSWPVPKYLDATVKPQFLVEYIVSEAAAPAEGEIVAFSLEGYSVGDGDNTTAAFGAAVTSSKTHGAGDAQHDRYTTAQSGDVTVTDLAAGELAFFKLKRLATTTDTYAQKVAVCGVKILWRKA